MHLLRHILPYDLAKRGDGIFYRIIDTIKAIVTGQEINDLILRRELNLKLSDLTKINESFDRDYYNNKYSDIAESNIDPLLHYISCGWLEGKNPTNWFSTKYYLDFNKDVRTSGVNPFVHYILDGKKEGRIPNKDIYIEQQTSEKRALEKEEELLKSVEIIKNSGLFCPDYYLEKYSDVYSKGVEPVRHYCENGWKEKRQPSPDFDVRIYSNKYPILEALSVNPLLHHIRVNEKKKARDIFCSVVMPTYNRSKLLPGLFEKWKAVKKQSVFEFELIICDDGSDDDSINIIEKIKDLPIVLLKLDHNGPGAARNAGVNAAKGEVILFIGDDVYPSKNLINQHCICHIHNSKELAVLGLVEWPNDVLENHLMHHITNIGCEQFGYGVFIPYHFYDFKHFYTCNISLRTEKLKEQSYLFSNRFKNASFEDIELGYRLQKQGLKIIYNPDAKGYHYHEYAIGQFIKRQTIAGEMSTIFRELCGPGVESLVEIDEIKKRYIESINYFNNDSQLNLTWILSHIIRILSSFDSIHTNNLPISIQSKLSFIYSIVFKYYAEVGVLKSVFETLKPQTEKFFCKKINSMSIVNSIIELHSFLRNNANETRRLEDINIVALESALKFLNHKNKRQSKICIVININELTAYREKYKTLEESLVFLTDSTFDDRLFDIDYWYYYPSDIKKSISVMKLQQVLLSATKHNMRISQLIVVETLKSTDDPSILSNCKHVFYHNHRNKPINEKKASNLPLLSKIIRLLPIENISRKPLTGLSHSPETSRLGYSVVEGSVQLEALNISNYLTPRDRFEIHVPEDKPFVFVLPTYLAAGGVERLTATMIKQLSEDFRFVVINTEGLNSRTGSLHHSFEPICDGIYDLFEIVPDEFFLECINDLKCIYKPSLVWICNGSVWLSKNYMNMRKLFPDIPIIDQEVYDVSKGWINNFHDKDLQTFDRFIAINSKIRERFINDFGIDEEKVDLIYHAIDSARFNMRTSPIERKELVDKYNLNSEIPIYATIGRLANQKRPELFLQMVEIIQDQSIDAEFIMIGDGPLADDIDYIINKKSLKIKRLGFVDNVAALLEFISGVIFTSEYEGLPIASLEAMCYDIPIFSTDVGDLGIVLKKYNAGQTLPVNSNGAELAKAFRLFHEKIKQGYYNQEDFSTKIRRDFSDVKIASLYKRSWQKGMSKYSAPD